MTDATPSPEPCERAERLAARALDGEASNEERAELAAHQAACAACRATADVWDRLGGAFAARVDAVLAEEPAPPIRVVATTPTPVTPLARPFRPARSGGATVAAAAAILLVAGFLAWLLAHDGGSPERDVVAGPPELGARSLASASATGPGTERASSGAAPARRMPITLTLVAPARSRRAERPRDVIGRAVAASVRREESGRIVLDLRR